jgi:hypothetical protein
MASSPESTSAETVKRSIERSRVWTAVAGDSFTVFTDWSPGLKFKHGESDFRFSIGSGAGIRRSKSAGGEHESIAVYCPIGELGEKIGAAGGVVAQYIAIREKKLLFSQTALWFGPEMPVMGSAK